MKSKQEMNTFAQQMRRSKTRAEQTAYNQLKDTFIRNGTGFSNQVIFGYYILDFVIPSKMLVVELDGSSHNDRAAYDARRDAFCVETGLQVLRVQNQNAQAVADLVSAYPFASNWLEKWERAKKLAAKAKDTSKPIEVLAKQHRLVIPEESFLHLSPHSRKEPVKRDRKARVESLTIAKGSISSSKRKEAANRLKMKGVEDFRSPVLARRRANGEL
jgi:very-short-patch-repair endonuclease